MKTQKMIIHSKTKYVIAKELKLANTFLTRLKGLIGSTPLAYKQGLLISPCQQIHTHFMAYNIDVVFLNKEFKVLHIIKKMPPWRFSKYIKTAYYTLELPENGTNHLQVDDILALVE